VVVLTSFIVFYDLIDGYFAYKEREKELLLIEKKNEKILSGYRTLENSQQNVYQLYHDLKKHLSIINVMENKTEIHAYLEKCFENIQDMDGSIQTGNPYIDMFLYNEWKRIHELGIKVQFAVQEGSLEKIELHDLIVILGNALENASEACEKRLEQNGDAYMQLKIIKKEHQVFIILSNNYSGNIEKRGDVYITSKKEKELHGMGMKNISDSIKKYGGDMSISLKNGKFVLKILLDVL
jgi:sensor histidine kinase regulating citrate/malate metabolism